MPLNENLFTRVVPAAFLQRRKTLKNTPGSLLIPADVVTLSFDAGLDAKTLPVSTYESITRLLSSRNSSVTGSPQEKPMKSRKADCARPR